MNLAVDDKALMQPFVGPRFFGNRTRLCWNRLLFAQWPTPAGNRHRRVRRPWRKNAMVMVTPLEAGGQRIFGYSRS
jgi:hypothetical protein